MWAGQWVVSGRDLQSFWAASPAQALWTLARLGLIKQKRLPKIENILMAFGGLPFELEGFEAVPDGT